jgi:hypothetical protein
VLSRRNFVRGTLLAPFAGALLRPSTIRAQTTAVARRLIIFFSPNGTVHRHWRPDGTGTTYNFPAGSMLEPLATLRNELTIVDGLDFKNGNNHEGGMSTMLTGGGAASSPSEGMSVDQFIAGRLNSPARFSSLELGVQTSAWGGNTQTRMCYRRAGEHIAPADRPSEVYRRLFGDSAGPTGADLLLAKRKSVLDLVREELGALQTALGNEERAKLDAHLTSLRSVELSLSGGSAPPSTGCAPPADPLASDPGQNDNFPAVCRAQTDLLVSALSCDLTRVASLQCSHTVSPTVFSWLGIGDGHHSLSHTDDSNAAGIAQFIAAERWFAEQFAYLVDKLKTLPEPSGAEGSMLDHSLVVWVKELGDSRLHECRSVPFVLAGRAGGYLSPGKYLRYDSLSHQHLLVSICRAMGVETEVFGDPAIASGELEGLR